VLTLDPRRPAARAIAVAGGRVLAIGDRLGHLAGRGTERVDCRGATVLPGLIDPHLHLYALATHDAQLDCAAPDVATLLAQDAAVCLLDEPINHLDPQHRNEVLALFRARADAGSGIVPPAAHDAGQRLGTSLPLPVVALSRRDCRHALTHQERGSGLRNVSWQETHVTRP